MTDITLSFCEKHKQWWTQDCSGCTDTSLLNEFGEYLLDHYKGMRERGDYVGARTVHAMILNYEMRFKVKGLQEKCMEIVKQTPIEFCGIDDGDEDCEKELLRLERESSSRLANWQAYQ